MRIAGALVLLLAAACAPDSTYSDIARKHIVEKGPAGACCTELGPAISPECAAEAPTKCAFAKDATVTVGTVTKQGSEDAALVALTLTGPNGNGVCRVFVSNFFGSGRKRGLRVQSAHCKGQ